MIDKQMNWLELFVGTVVIILTVSLLIFTYFTVRLSGSGKDVFASFESVNGLNVGSDVRISGIKVGSVTGMKLNRNDNWAVIHMRIQDDIKIPKDSAARLSMEGILGSVFIEIQPGGAQEYLQPGEHIQYTDSMPNLLDLVTKLFVSFR